MGFEEEFVHEPVVRDYKVSTLQALRSVGERIRCGGLCNCGYESCLNKVRFETWGKVRLERKDGTRVSLRAQK